MHFKSVNDNEDYAISVMANDWYAAVYQLCSTPPGQKVRTLSYTFILTRG